MTSSHRTFLEVQHLFRCPAHGEWTVVTPPLPVPALAFCPKCARFDLKNLAQGEPAPSTSAVRCACWPACGSERVSGRRETQA